MKLKFIWRVSPKETGRYASFHKRGWPSADYTDGSYCASISELTGKEYVPAAIKNGVEFKLKLSFADYSEPKGNCPWTRKTFLYEFKSIKEVKAYLKDYFERNPQKVKSV